MKKLNVDEAVAALLNGLLVVVPTETVYGLAVDGTNDRAIERLYQLKGRPSSNPIMLQVADGEMLEDVAAIVPGQAQILMEGFWPGPLTIVLPKRPEISGILSAGTGNIGIRMPDQKQTLEILRKVGRPLAVPSANLSGQPAPITPEEVEKAWSAFDPLKSGLAGMVDAGPCSYGEASTVLDLTGCCQPHSSAEGNIEIARNNWRIIREGPVSFEQIAAVIGNPL